MALDPTIESKINQYLTLVNEPTLTTNEVDLLGDISCKYENYTGDCLALYLLCLVLRWRGNCTGSVLPQLQMLCDCNGCNINVDSVVNNKADKIFFGGISVKPKCNNDCC